MCSSNNNFPLTESLNNVIGSATLCSSIPNSDASAASVLFHFFHY